MVSRVLICTGKYANEPYHLEKVCVNVYCVEELCYLFANNPFMINTEIRNGCGNSVVSRSWQTGLRLP